MAKSKSVYVCSSCGNDSPKWLGKCPICGEWNSYVEELISKDSSKRGVGALSFDTPKSRPMLLKDVETGEDPRLDLHDDELN